MGSMYLYFRFQDQAPLTGRSRWLATNPNFEKRLGDEVSPIQFIKTLCHNTKETVEGRLPNAITRSHSKCFQSFELNLLAFNHGRIIDNF